MKFNEKLVKLRKENLLTQEELAEKLGVTRQTISKWELGQTVPDKDDLVEMSKLFSISASELLDESDTTQKVTDTNTASSSTENSRKTIIIVVGILAALAVLAWVIWALIFGKIFSTGKEIISGKTGSNLINDLINTGKQIAGEFELDNRSIYEMNYSGMKMKSAVNQVILDNAKNDNKITVKYNDTSASTTEELSNLMLSLNSYQYLITYEYDENENIITMKITDVVDDGQQIVDEFNKAVDEQNKKADVDRFNSVYDSLYTGMQSKFFTEQAIKKVITNNIQNERKITVKFGKTSAKATKELTSLIAKLTKDQYIITYDHDEDGYITTMIISNV